MNENATADQPATVAGTGPRETAGAIAHFSAKLAYETDPSDLAALRAGAEPPIIVDTRSRESWDQGHIPGAIHLPGNQIPTRAAQLLPDPSADIVVYCWGPGCNGSTRAALALSRLGYTRVRELIGGFEYWAREGMSIRTSSGRTRRPVDDLTAPIR
ncbi:rhodanese-like domain-containing protein [Streptomyces sp. RPT161]|uniref:rhodanese-like domain-containing protein n=1 Tax=Streptomyces sp. RPT161 TaxID=3015993 RepID=UPI0022B90452|nr:rhodanese-like domain-containing protein [Streptomyces sp. RPT161]